TLDGLQGARTALARVDECTGKLRELAAGQSSSGADGKFLEAFSAAMDNDLNVAAAWGVVFDWVRETNRRLAENSMSSGEAAGALAAWEKVDSVLGIGKAPETEAPPELLALLEERQVARKSKNFKRSDEIRDELKA